MDLLMLPPRALGSALGDFRKQSWLSSKEEPWPSSQTWGGFSLESVPVEEEAWLPSLAETGPSSSSSFVRCDRAAA